MPSLNRTIYKNSFNNLVAYLLFLAIIGIILLSLIFPRGWNLFFELASHFQIQYLFLSLFLFALLALTRKRTLLAIALFFISVQLTNILPWYIPQATANVKEAGKLRILSSNINVQNNSYSKVISLVRKEKPDIAIFMEIDDVWVKQFQALTDILPYSFKKPNPYNLGIGIYSKLPLDNLSINFFGTPNNPSLVGNLSINGQDFSLIATHPLPPIRQDYFHSRNKQFDEISEYVQELKTPTIVVGDLNITMWSSYYKRFIQKTGLQNARKGFGILPTWPIKPTFSPIPSILSPFLWIPIDHCLVSPEIKVANIRTGENVDSDHLPLIADLMIPITNKSSI